MGATQFEVSRENPEFDDGHPVVDNNHTLHPWNGVGESICPPATSSPNDSRHTDPGGPI